MLAGSNRQDRKTVSRVKLKKKKGKLTDPTFTKNVTRAPFARQVWSGLDDFFIKV